MARPSPQQPDAGAACRLARVPVGPLAARDQRPRLHPAELRAVPRRRRRSWPRHRADAARSGRTLTELFAEERRKGVLDISQIPSSITAHAPGYIDREREIIVGLQTEAPLKRAIMPNGGFRMVARRAEGVRLRAGPARRRDVHQVPQDAQRRGLRRLHRRHPALPQLAHPHRPARRLRPRPHHRRLPSRRALRRDAARRAQAAGEGGARRRDVDRRDHPRSRGAGRADPRAQRAAADGRRVRVRHLAPGPHGARGRPVALLRLPGGGQGTERRRHVARAHLDVPRRLLRTRPRRRAPSPRSRPRRSSTTS